jgi:hypothetical protein
MPATIEARDLRTHNKPPLTAFVTLVLPSGLVIKECAYFERDGKRWVSLPTRSYTTRVGKTAYSQILDFETPSAKARFQAQALAALDELLKGES